MNKISPLAFIHPDAKIGDNVTIEAFSYIDNNVEIADNCHIRPHASIKFGSRLAQGVQVFDGAVIGAEPQDFRWKGEVSYCDIDHNTVIREHVIINRSIRGGGSTKVGHDSFIMAQTHIGHDSEIGKRCVIGNAVKIAGNCTIDDFSIMSSNSLIHENCSIGRWVLVKGGCRVNGNVPPFCIVAHNPVEYCGTNTLILQMGKFPDDAIDKIAQCYRMIYHGNTSLFNALRRIELDVDPCRERDDVLNFIREHNLKIVAMPSDMNDD